jgi:hypothetical protein
VSLSTPGGQLVIILDWSPHIQPDDPIEAESLRFAVFRLCDEAYDALVDAGMDADEAITTVRICLAS